MKKVFLSIVIAAFMLVVANFALWFFNTAAITKSLEQLKVALAKEDLIFDYKEVRFDSFKSWQIEGVIDEPSLQIKVVGSSFNVSTPRINFISKPFADEMMISMPGNHLAYSFVDKVLNYNKDAKLQFDKEATPVIVFSFNKSLNELVPLLGEDGKSVFKAMKSVTFEATNISLIDAKTNMIEQTTKKMFFDLRFSFPHKDQIEIDSIFRVIDTEFSKEFIDTINKLPEHLRDMYTLLTKLGKNDYVHDVKMVFNVSTEKLSKDFRLDIKEFKFGNMEFGINSKGYVRFVKGKTLPEVDLALTVENYQMLVNFYKDYFKAVARASESDTKYAGIKHMIISDERAQTVKNILANFATSDGKNAELIFSTADDNFKISGKSLAEVLAIIQPLIPSMQEQPKPEENKAQPPTVLPKEIRKAS